MSELEQAQAAALMAFAEAMRELTLLMRELRAQAARESSR